MIRNNKFGFTLIEILVVVSIIGVLSSITISSFATAQAKARDTRRMQDLKQIGNALNMYYNDNGQYPQTGGYWLYSSDSIGWGKLRDALVPKYISKLPVDPINEGIFITSNPSYSYLYAILNSSYSDYDLVARAELDEPYACPNKIWDWNSYPKGQAFGYHPDPTSWCDYSAFDGEPPNKTRIFGDH